MKVLIFGCGPAGLLSAHAVASSGHDPVIFSRLRKSPMRGAQYLHKPIPGLPEDQFKINYVLVGEPDVYRTKVYGPSSDVRVSVESLQGVSPAWDIRTVYDDLWARYKRLVSDRNLTPTEINRAIKSVKPDITISTIPAKLLCNGVRHTFSSTHVWVSEEASYLPPGSDNLVVCSGMLQHRWYRQSRVHGWENTEWPANSFTPYLRHGDRAVQVVKPIATDCNCFPDVRRMGRYGRWKKGILSHTAYDETLELVRGA